MSSLSPCFSDQSHFFDDSPFPPYLSSYSPSSIVTVVFMHIRLILITVTNPACHMLSGPSEVGLGFNFSGFVRRKKANTLTSSTTHKTRLTHRNGLGNGTRLLWFSSKFLVIHVFCTEYQILVQKVLN